MSLVLLLNAASTWALCGLIWTVQLLHYPLFARVGREAFPAYHAAHSLAITPLVGSLMCAEAVTALALVVRPPQGVGPLPVWAGLLLVLAHVMVTALVSVPLHARLGQGFDAEVVRDLVQTNWLRTIIWTVRALLLLEMLRLKLR